MYSQRYLYGEDSKLLGEVLSKLDGADKLLEIGVGGAANLTMISDRIGLAVGTDILSQQELARVKCEGIDLIVADRASCFRESVFDTIAFNPPYLRSEMIQDTTVDGGRDGIQVPLSFLSSALEVLKPKGRIFVLLSSESSLDLFQDFCRDHDLEVQIVAEKRMFFESILVFLITKKLG